jgi:hypothetical protein
MASRSIEPQHESFQRFMRRLLREAEAKGTYALVFRQLNPA